MLAAINGSRGFVRGENRQANSEELLHILGFADARLARHSIPTVAGLIHAAVDSREEELGTRQNAVHSTSARYLNKHWNPSILLPRCEGY